jgi:DNA-binding NarL/FixJ family response regulator
MMVVDDHPVVRRGLVSLLSGEAWVGLVLEADTAHEARRLATTSRLDVAVVDLGLPDGDGIELIAYLAATAPGCGLLVMTMTRDPDTVRAALAAGARGYLLKDTAPELLVAAVRTVAGGGQVLGPTVDLDRAAPTRATMSPLDQLTPRERQLLALLARGLSTRDMAHRLTLSEKTVRNLISIITGKLGVADRVQAVILARRHGGHT